MKPNGGVTPSLSKRKMMKLKTLTLLILSLTVCSSGGVAEEQSLIDCKLRLQNAAKTIAWFESLNERELQTLEDLKQPDLLPGGETWFYPPDSKRRHEYLCCPVSGLEYEFVKTGHEWTLSCPGDWHGAGQNSPTFQGFCVI